VPDDRVIVDGDKCQQVIAVVSHDINQVSFTVVAQQTIRERIAN
jgi:hypothetical protein